MSIEKTIGIDLGTTRTAVAEIISGDPEIVDNAEGRDLTPSVVRIDEDGDALVGKAALNTATQYPNRTIREIKRQMGTDDPVIIDDREYLPEQISALILQKVVSDAEDRIGQDVSDVVITVPAYFGENERSATKSAGEIAGLNIERLLPEPSAACLTYGFRKQKLDEGGEELVFVYDLGGGTFDASLVEIDYDINYFETKHTDGINDLGGKDWTDRIVEWMVEKIEQDTGENPSNNNKAMERIRNEAIATKHSLSSKKCTNINIPFLLEGYDFEAELSRETFNEITSDLIDQTTDPINDLFERATVDVGAVDTVLAIGGSSRMAQVDEFIIDYFGQEPSKEVNPDKAVAIGAAIQADILSVETGVDENSEQINGVAETTVTHVVSKPLGVELHDGSMSFIIETDEVIPVHERKETFSTIRDDQTQVNFPVLEGDSDLAKDNDNIGQVKLGENDPIPPRSPDEASLAVEFIYDKNGTLEVEAEDLISGRNVDAVFEGVGSHSKRDIDEMQQNLPGLKE